MVDDHGHPRSGRVRIIGAAPAASRAGDPVPDEPVDEVDEGDADDAGGQGDEGGPLVGDDAVADLPHWTEAPTGQVPAVLARGRDDDDSPWGALPEPTWREERSDWAAHEEAFDPSVLAMDVGPEDEGERQPWTFDLDTTAVVPAVPAVEPDEDPPVAPQDRRPGRARRAPPGGDPGWEAGGGVGDRGAPNVAADWGSGEVPGEGAPGERTTATEGSGRGARGGRDGVGGWAVPAEQAPWRVPDERPEAHPDERPELPDGDGDGDGELAGRELPGGAPDDLDATLPPSVPAGRRHLGGSGREPSILDLPPREVEDRVSRTGGRRRATGTGAPLPPPVAPVPGGRRGVPPAPAQHERGGRNLPIAIASGVAVGAVAILCFYFGTVTSMVLVTAVVGLAAIEGYAAFRKAGYHPATLLGLVAVVGVMIGAYDKGEAAEPLVVVLLVAFTLVWHLLRVDRGVSDPVRSTLATFFVYGWVGVFGSYAALLLSPANFPDRHGIAYLFGAVATVVAYDVAALGIGSWVGHRPLSSVSPNKTWEGLIGGSVAALVVAVMLVHLVHPWTVGKAAALGVIVIVLAPIGDLAESLVKRHVGLKDMGRLLPGHGGVLDRIDGLLFVLPATYYLVRAFHLG